MSCVMFVLGFLAGAISMGLFVYFWPKRTVDSVKKVGDEVKDVFDRDEEEDNK